MPKIPELTQSSRVKFFSTSAPRSPKAVIGRGLQQLGQQIGNTALAFQRADASMKAADKALAVGEAREGMRRWLLKKTEALATDGSDGTKDVETLSKEYDEFFLSHKDNYDKEYSREIGVQKDKMFNDHLLKAQATARVKKADAIKGKLDNSKKSAGNVVLADPTQLISQIMSQRGTLGKSLKALEQSEEQIDKALKEEEKYLIAKGIDGWMLQQEYDKARDWVGSTFRGRFSPDEVKKSLELINKQEHDEKVLELSMENAEQKKLDRADKDRRDKIVQKFIFDSADAESLQDKLLVLNKAKDLGKTGIIKYEDMKDILSGDSTLMKRKAEKADYELESIYSHKQMTPKKMKDVVIAYVTTGETDLASGKRWLKRLNIEDGATSNKGTKADSDGILTAHLLPDDYAKASFLTKSDDTMKHARARQYRTEIYGKGGVTWEEAAYLALEQYAPGADISKFIPGIPAKDQRSLEALDGVLPKIKALYQGGAYTKEQYRDNLIIFKKRKQAQERDVKIKEIESTNKAAAAAKALMNLDITGDFSVNSDDEYIQIPYAPNQGE